jgi:hypothetical protein
MSDALEITKTVAPFAAPFIAPIVEIFVKPKIQRLSKFLKGNKAESLISVEAKFEEYLNRSYEKHSYIPILIFQNQQKKLEDIYIPLTVRKQREKENFLLDTYPKKFLPKYKKILIRDTAGMGKSTLMKKLFLSSLEMQQGIPIFIELRKLKGDDSITSFIHRELNPINDEFDQEFILNLIKDGSFIFFLDGYDEIAQADREKVTQNLHDFISKTGKNLFIMTSRPETSLASFPDFMEFDIQPLELEEAFTLLRKYDECGELAEEIISKLEGKTLESVKDFLTNPLLVSLLYKSYDYKPTIPLKKHVFYRQVYDALYEHHDLTKPGAYIREKYCGLDSDSFHTVLRALGFITLKYGVEYDKDQILSFLKKAKEQCSTIEFKESKFLDDLLKTVPLFTMEGNNYRWSHKSLQDYFAAQFIWLDSNEKKSIILRNMVRSEESSKYYNVLDLYYEMDYKSFRQIIILDYLSEFLAHYESPTKIKAENKLTQKEINDIKFTTFGVSYFFIPRNFGHIINEDDEILIRLPLVPLLEEEGFICIEFTSYDGMAWVSGETIQVFVDYNYSLTTLLNEKSENIYQVNPYNFTDEAILLGEEKPPGFIGISSSLIVIENNYKLSQFLNYLNFNFFQYLFDKCLDVNKCRKMKAEIEAEIKKEASNDLFESF